MENIAVWERCNEYGFWETFHPNVCKEIEKDYEQFQKYGDDYQINQFDFNKMEHVTLNSKCAHSEVLTLPMRRLVFPLTSFVANGITWQWNTRFGDDENYFVDYPAKVIEYIEKKYQKGKTTIYLSKNFPTLCYTLDLKKYWQNNNSTGFHRYIRRHNREAFPRTINIIPKTPSTSTNQPKKENAKNIPKTHVLFMYAKVIEVEESNEDDCCICMTPLQEESGFAGSSAGPNLNFVLELNICRHTFHGECLDAALKNNQSIHGFMCPYCKKIYGVKTGNQPPGSMTDSTVSIRLPGFPCNTIEIRYDFSSGIQENGQRYSAHSFPRTAYLPNNKEGKKVLKMLKVAWQRRLIFTVGTSVTSGQPNCVTWNEIHHKTSINNHGGHGYPDGNYLTNVVAELSALGVTENDIS